MDRIVTTARASHKPGGGIKAFPCASTRAEKRPGRAAAGGQGLREAEPYGAAAELYSRAAGKPYSERRAGAAAPFGMECLRRETEIGIDLQGRLL